MSRHTKAAPDAEIKKHQIKLKVMSKHQRHHYDQHYTSALPKASRQVTFAPIAHATTITTTINAIAIIASP